MTNQFAKVSIIIFSSLLLAGCTKPDSSKPANISQNMSEAQEFAKAIESGKPTHCTITKDASTIEYFIKGKTIAMTTPTGHMISDTKYLYTWDDKTKQGSKMLIPTEEEAKQMIEQKQGAQPNQNLPKLESQADFDTFKNDGYNVKCQGENIDDKIFVPPTDVKFIDPSEMMKAIPTQGAAGSIDMSKLEDLQKQFGGENN